MRVVPRVFAIVADRFRKGLTVFRLKSALGALALVALVGTVSAKADTVTLPDTGANISGLVSAGITAIGAIVAVIVGGYFAFLVIKLAMKWARRMA